jgi:hypothetical protein
MREHSLTTKDIFYPDSEKINDFNELFTSNEILPIFSDSVMQWADLVERKCSEYNALNPEYTINPNFILAIMSIESQGRPVVESGAGAQGLLQVMPLTAFSILYPGVDSKEFDNYEAAIIRELSNPEKNLEISLKYFKQLLQTAKSHELDGAIKWEYVSMKYNGGWNADKYFETSEFFSTLTNSEKAESYLSVKDMDGVKKVLLDEFGSTTVADYEYHTYGPKMVKKETLKYGEKLLRFVMIAQMAAELKNNSASDEEIKKILETPQVVKDLMGKIKGELNKIDNPDYFEEREVYERYLTEDLDMNSLNNSYIEDRSNTANFLMYP